MANISFTTTVTLDQAANLIEVTGDEVTNILVAEPGIGKTSILKMLEERDAGLYGEFQVSSVARGDQALELVNDGVIDSFSVGFSGIKAEKRGGVTVRTEVKLREASLVTFPAYDTARITAIRAALSDVGELPDDAIEALVRAFDLRDLTQIPATTDDGQPEQIVSPVDEPASATRDVSAIHRSLRLKAREIGLI